MTGSVTTPGRDAVAHFMAAALLGLADHGDRRPVRPVRPVHPVRRAVARWAARAFDRCFHALVRAILEVTR